ncbi:MAG: ribonuclease E [Gammaproteobacteria bacterium]|nr:MAG: ribonuclease E [Gammaproteobacteria bacterium]
MKRMLINATQPEELRVAIADGQHLFDLDIEVPSQEQKKSNVYKGRITRVEPSLEACFVEFGSARHGFLPLKEICPSSYAVDAHKKDGKIAIRDAVREGQEIIVQVEKEERGNKGAALTTYISLAGRYLVLMPTNPSAGGVSRRITGTDRDHLREQLQQVTTPDNVGIIIRTAGVGRDADELQWDLDYLLQLWTAIEQAATSRKAPFLIYQESNLFIRALRDHLRNDIGEILIDNEKVYNDAREFMQQVMPHNLGRLKLYRDQVPLFSRYQIESQIESAFARTVHLPSGGAVVIDHTEALLSIDINSARATKGSDIEETAYNTNMESAVEIARQLRLRDLGGLIVIDFIDMTSRKHQREVEECLRQALQFDKARVQIGRISRFGLLEMSRQRLRPSLGESSQETCPVCEGHGTIRSVESLALSILRLVEEEVMKDYTGQIVVQAPNDVVNFLHNEKRAALAEVENRHSVPIMMLANEHMLTPHFEIHRVKKSDISDVPSYQRVIQPEAQLVANERSQVNIVSVPEPAVKRIVPERSAPVRSEEKVPGLFSRLANILFTGAKEQERQPASRKTTAQKASSPQGNQQNRRRSTQSNRQQTKRKTSKKRTSRDGRPSGRQPRSSKKRTAKKTQSGPGHNKQASTPSGQSKGGRSKDRPARSQQSPADKGKAVAGDIASTASVNSVQTGRTPGTTDGKTAGRKAGQEQKDTSGRKGGHRRRSPYKTGGSKSHPEHNEPQAGKSVPAPSPAADSTPDPSRPTDSKSEARAAKPVADKSPRVDKPTADSPAKGTDTKAASTRKVSVEKPAGSNDKPAKVPTKPADKKPAGKKAVPRKDPDRLSKPAADPVAEPQQGTRGLYTLKPEPAKKPAQVDTEV